MQQQFSFQILCRFHLLCLLGSTVELDPALIKATELWIQSTPLLATVTKFHPQWKRQRRCERKQKRSKHGGIRTRLLVYPHKPAILRNILADVDSLKNTVDYIQPFCPKQRMLMECSVFVFMETGVLSILSERKAISQSWHFPLPVSQSTISLLSGKVQPADNYLSMWLLNTWGQEWGSSLQMDDHIVDDLPWAANTKAKLNKGDWWILTVSG